MRFHTKDRRTRLVVLLAIAGALIIMSAPGVVLTAMCDGGPAVKVTIISDGQEWEYVSSQETVGGILQEAGIGLGAKDRVYPMLSTSAAEGTRIRVTRVTECIVIQKEPVKYKRVVKLNPYATTGQTIVRKGVHGEKEIRYLVTYKDGVKSASKIVDARVTKQPVNEVISVSRRTILASRSGSYLRSHSMVATAYAPFHCGGSASGRAANGMRAGYGIVAVDPRVIPLGTKLYVEGYGPCLAGDTGGAIKGARIDLCFDTYSEAIRFGRRRVTVYVLE